MTEMTLNIGPHHPSTHGVLRLITKLDGEKILDCDPEIGYLHRGMEKLAETRTYLQYLPLVDRIDYLSGFFNSFAYCDAIENLGNITVPDRAKYIRILMLELNRISSHLLWLGTYLLDLGAVSPYFYAFRERELILNFFEKLTGQRLMYNYFKFGGVRKDIDFIKDIQEITKVLPKKLNDYEKIITKNPIFKTRTQNIGILEKETALDYSITGPNLRSTGIKLDLRKQSNYYNNLEFDIVTTEFSDCYNRYLIRIDEMRQSLQIITQCLDWLLTDTSTEIFTKINETNLTLPKGEYISSVEAPRGITLCCLVSDESNQPYRVKWRTGSFYAVQLLPLLLKNVNLPDIMAIYGSLDVILPEVDR